MVGRKNYYGSGSVVSAALAGRVWTITATAQRAGLNPLAHLTAYLDECARAGGTAPTGEALTRFLPWAATPDDRTTWAHDPRPNPDTSGNDPTEPATTGDDTGSGPDPRAGPAP